MIYALLAAGILCYGALVAFVCYQEAHVPAAAGQDDAMIVLGAQVYPDGEPSLQLALRLEAALAEYLKNPVPIVTCGGQGPNEPRPEGDVMRDWLVLKGVDPADVLADDTSVSTRGNIHNAITLLKEYNPASVRIVTSDYHLPRALAIARDEGLTATGTGSPCKPEYWAPNHFREALAWVKYWGQKYLNLPLE